MTPLVDLLANLDTEKVEVSSSTNMHIEHTLETASLAKGSALNFAHIEEGKYCTGSLSCSSCYGCGGGCSACTSSNCILTYGNRPMGPRPRE